MKENIVQFIKTGDDPSQYVEFGIIKSEINKLSHPRQLQVDWKLIEKNALILFEKNGIDLLTISYYTLARYNNDGFTGFVEGCELLAALIHHKWDQLWPMQEISRIDALDWFNSRIGNLIRKLTFTREDIIFLQRASNSLEIITVKIQQLPLKRLPKIVDLYDFIKTNLDTLDYQLNKNSSKIKHKPIRKTLIYAPEVTKDDELNNKQSTLKHQEDILPEVLINTPSITPPNNKKRFSWACFGLGMLFAIIFCFGITQFFNYQHEQKLAIAGPNLSWFNKKQTALPNRILIDNPNIRAEIYENYKMQLLEITSHSPISFYYYADNLVNNMQSLWPDSPEHKQLYNDWQKIFELKKIYHNKKLDFNNVVNKVDMLKSEVDYAIINNQYITLDYLHNALTKIQEELENQKPIEEVLREIEDYQQTNAEIPDKLKQDFHQQLQALILRYYLIEKQN